MNNILNIIILSGIPGSGKSYWSYDYIKNNPNTKRINRDDLRHMLDNDKSTDGTEKFVKLVKLSLVELLLNNDKDVLLDDTHCYKDKLIELIEQIKNISLKLNIKIKIKVVNFDINLDVAYHQNLSRERKIDYKIIKYMFIEKSKIDYNKLDVDNILVIK